MKVVLDWLREYAPLDAPLEELVRCLIDAGIEVDAVHRGGDGVVVARIAALAVVPESRRGVQLVDIDAGTRSVRLLTGASNIRVGDLVPWAQPGTLLPGADERLGVRQMFGRYESPGMLCSPVELGLGNDADGILILERGTPGEPLSDVIDLGVTLDVEVTTNRPDCLGHVGVARELAASLGETLREPSAAVADDVRSAASVAGRVGVRVEEAVGCNRFIAMVIESVAVGPSPEWMQRRLRAIGLRPINNVVDVTNYVMYELGQPLHAFDFDRVVALGGGRTAELTVRRARAGETLACLDGVERALDAHDLVVCAADVVASLAAIVGGSETAITESTRSVILECASWDAPTVRATSRRLGLRTDASALFEKGISDTLPPAAIARAATLIAELAHGHVLRDSIDVHPHPLPTVPPISVSEGFLEARLGAPVTADEAAVALAHLGFTVEQDGRLLRVLPPHFRRDVTIPEDIVEEVGRSIGYGRIPSTLPGRRRPVGPLAPPMPREDAVRDICVGAGLDEAVTYSFISTDMARGLTGAGGPRTPIAIRNPISEDWAVMRTSLLPGLVDALAGNVRRGALGVGLFEVGCAFWADAPDASAPDAASADVDDPPLPAEPTMLAIAIHAADGDGAASALHHIQATLDRLASELGRTELAWEPVAIPQGRSGRSARITCAGSDVGVLAELMADAVDTLDIRGRVVVAEVSLAGVVPSVAPTPHFQHPPRFPAVTHDLAVVVSEDVPAGRALRAIRDAGGDLIEEVELYDEYRDDKVGNGRKGWTFRLTFRAPDRTLTGAEAAQQQTSIERLLAEVVGAEVRR